MGNAVFKEQKFIGVCTKSEFEIKSIISEMKLIYTAKSYHLINKNCNHFADDLFMKLCNEHLPGFINRVAGVGETLQPVLSVISSDLAPHKGPHEGTGELASIPIAAFSGVSTGDRVTPETPLVHPYDATPVSYSKFATTCSVDDLAKNSCNGNTVTNKSSSSSLSEYPSLGSFSGEGQSMYPSYSLSSQFSSPYRTSFTSYSSGIIETPYSSVSSSPFSSSSSPSERNFMDYPVFPEKRKEF
jgi:hypothetical protein